MLGRLSGIGVIEKYYIAIIQATEEGVVCVSRRGMRVRMASVKELLKMYPHLSSEIPALSISFKSSDEPWPDSSSASLGAAVDKNFRSLLSMAARVGCGAVGLILKF